MRHDGDVSSSHATASERKSGARAAIRGVRWSRPEPWIEQSSRQISEFALPVVTRAEAHCVAGYFASAAEPAVDLLMAQLRARGVVVLTPVVRDSGLEWRQTDAGSQLTAGAHGIREVVDGREASLAEADVILVPALAIDRNGVRLGQGGGYYDRALASLAHSPLLVGVVFADEDEVEVAAEAHDARVDVVVTETGVRWIRRAPGSATS